MKGRKVELCQISEGNLHIHPDFPPRSMDGPIKIAPSPSEQIKGGGLKWLADEFDNVLWTAQTIRHGWACTPASQTARQTDGLGNCNETSQTLPYGEAVCITGVHPERRITARTCTVFHSFPWFFVVALRPMNRVVQSSYLAQLFPIVSCLFFSLD